MTEPLITQSALQKALANESEAVRARVLEIALHAEIEPDEPFFKMFEAMGFLKVLIEDAPERWREILNNFGGNLDQWSENNTQLLQSVTEQRDKVAEVVGHSEQLSASVSSLERLISQQSEALEDIQLNLKRQSSNLAQTTSQIARIQSGSGKLTIIALWGVIGAMAAVMLGVSGWGFLRMQAL